MKLSFKLGITVLISIFQFEICNCQNANTTLQYLDRTFDALQRALQFFDREHQTVNVDGWMTTRAMHGKLD